MLNRLLLQLDTSKSGSGLDANPCAFDARCVNIPERYQRVGRGLPHETACWHLQCQQDGYVLIRSVRMMKYHIPPKATGFRYIIV